MRLTCPNCGAQYEVPDDVIPATGRDVQCSNCGDTWFQYHADHMPASEEAEPETWEAEDEDDTSDQTPDQTPAQDVQPEETPAPARRELEPDVRDVLRQEAERERKARTADSQGLEIQPDLGLDDVDDEASRRSREAQTRMARLRGLPEEGPDDDVHAGIDPTSRRDLLPDIEEINSSLRAGDGGDADAMIEGAYHDELPSGRGGGFRRGFMLIVLLSVILVLIYVFAPRIGAKVPALADGLSAYVDAVNSGRLWLDGQVKELMLWLDSMSSDQG